MPDASRTPPEDQTEKILDQAADQLLELAGEFDEPFEKKDYPLAMLALGHRARTLLAAFLELQAGAVPIAAQALLRPMVEINMLLRFLRKNPDLHTELWQAEGERNTVTIAEEVRNSDLLKARLGGTVPLDDADLDARRHTVARARKRALEAGLPVGKGAMPSVSGQRVIINEPAADVVYTLVYRIASWDIHMGARTFLAGEWVERNDGTVSYEEIPSRKELLRSRSLAITTFASTIEIIAAELELTIEGEAHSILETVMGLEPDL